MLCPFSSGKSATTWLDRLHSSKGFTLPSPDLSLDHFLLNPTPNLAADDATGPPTDPALSSVRDSNSPSASPPLAEAVDGQKEEFIDLMRTALAELFHMGSPRRRERPRVFRDRRSVRKQLVPRPCVVSTPPSDGGSCPSGIRAVATPPTTSPSVADNSAFRLRKRAAEGKLKAAGKKKMKKKVSCLVSKDGETNGEMSSRTDVTVIDTSCSLNWKSAKIIFRKGTAWKVRDKKKWCLMRKERKFGSAQRVKNDHEMRQAATNIEENSFSLTRVAEVAERSIPDPNGDLPKGTLDATISFPEIRLQFSRSFRRARSKGHSMSHSQASASEGTNRTLLRALELP